MLIDCEIIIENHTRIVILREEQHTGFIVKIYVSGIFTFYLIAKQSKYVSIYI